MKKVFKIVILCIMMTPLRSMAQPSAGTVSEIKHDTASVNRLIQKSKESLATSPDSTILLATQARDLAEEIDFTYGKAMAVKYIGLGYFYQDKYRETLNYWTESLKILESINNKIGIANLLNNLAALYAKQDDNTKALEYSLKSLKISEETGDKLRISSAMNTVASIYYSNKGIWGDTALNFLLRALPLCEEIGDVQSAGIISENIGDIYFEKENDAKALEYYNKAIKILGQTANSPFAYNGIGKIYRKKGNTEQALKYHTLALSISEKTDGKSNSILSLEGIANVYVKKNDFPTAFVYFKKAEALAKELDLKSSLQDIYKEMAEAYQNAGDFKNAFTYQQQLAAVKDSLFNETSQKRIGFLQVEFDVEKKQNEIDLLTKDKDLQAISIKRQKFAKNAFMVGLLLAFTIALLIYRNYLNKTKTHKILNQQKNEIEGLLLNILPKEVAKELQTTGHATPRQYESVSVMFTDFQAFTVIADHMSPDELVAELDACFIAFDGIIEKYKLEKIKTIGDSYMCAGGIPVRDDNHIMNMVKAGLEIQQYVADHNSSRIQRGLRPWGVRIGIHVGPVIAGVVGKKKYAYDIWGSTVNIASRMESNGEPGRVNVSNAVFEVIKDQYACSYRGKVSAKNIGEIDMYFIEQKSNGKLNLTRTEELEVTQ